LNSKGTLRPTRALIRRLQSVFPIASYCIRVIWPKSRARLSFLNPFPRLALDPLRDPNLTSASEQRRTPSRIGDDEGPATQLSLRHVS